MIDQDKNKQQLIEELVELRQQIAAGERALQESWTAAALLQIAPLGIHECDTEGRITFVNPSQEAITGYTAEELLGSYVWDRIVPGPDKDSLPAYLKHLVSEQPPPTPYVSKNIRKNGELFDARVDWNYKRTPQRQVMGFVCIVSDITERKRAEEVLQKAYDELEEKVKERTAELAVFRRFAEASGSGFGMADLEGNVTYVNPTLCRLFGEEKPEDVLGKHVSAYYPEKYEQRRAEEILPALFQHGSWQGEQTLLSRNGMVIHAFQQSFLIRDEYGKPFRLAVAIADITELRKAEVALQRERRTLLRMLGASDHERQTIAYDIHDGLAQQLATASMQFQNYEYLKDRAASEAKSAYDAGIEMLQQAHSEARRLISGVRPPVFDEAGVAVAISHLIHDQWEHRGPQIEYHDDVEFDRLPPILESAIYRIAQEAITNACQHSRSQKVRVDLVQEGDFVRLEVQDWGIGFDPESVDENRFGLEGIKERTRLLGGELAIESILGEGTCIRVVLPMLENQ